MLIRTYSVTGRFVDKSIRGQSIRGYIHSKCNEKSG